MLANRYSEANVRESLLAREAWQPYPTADDRGAWSALPEATRASLVSRGEDRLEFAWPELPATLFLEFARVGNRSRFEWRQAARRNALRDLVLAECVEAKGRYLDDIVNGIWATCEETYWGYPAHVDAQAAGSGLPDVEEPTVDLFAAEAVALLAWTDYLLGPRLDAVSPLVRRRIAYEAQRRVLEPCLVREDFWWMGFEPAGHGVNNWNPWVNSNWLTANLLLEADPDRRAAAVSKVLASLDIFLATYAESGGCDEGPGYWGRAAASLFDCLDLLQSATAGAIDIFDEPKIRNMGRYIYRVQIDGQYYVNFADASAVVRPNGALVLRYGQAISDPQMTGFGSWLLGRGNDDAAVRGDSIGRMLPALFRLPDPSRVEPQQPRPGDVWFEGIQVMVARDQAGTSEGFLVAGKAGHNGESHNHNDVGNVIVYLDGKPLIVDAGVETYSRKTFSAQRYEIWTMQSANHTLLPSFDGVMQSPGETYGSGRVTYTNDDEGAALVADLAGAYPAEAGVQRWLREVRLMRGEEITITDRYEVNNLVRELQFALLTPSDVVVREGEITFVGVAFGPPEMDQVSASGRLVVPDAITGISVERLVINDARLGGVWGDGLNRVAFTVRQPPCEGTLFWRVVRAQESSLA